jgi:mercuric ion transport protein
MEKERLTGIGTILASLLAAACCIGPAAAIVFGASVGFLSGFMVLDPYRPYFLGAAALMLTYSFWRLYLVKRACDCESDARARRISLGIFWTGASLFLATGASLFLAAVFYQQVIGWVYG